MIRRCCPPMRSNLHQKRSPLNVCNRFRNQHIEVFMQRRDQRTPSFRRSTNKVPGRSSEFRLLYFRLGSQLRTLTCLSFLNGHSMSPTQLGQSYPALEPCVLLLYDSRVNFKNRQTWAVSNRAHTMTGPTLSKFQNAAGPSKFAELYTLRQTAARQGLPNCFCRLNAISSECRTLNHGTPYGTKISALFRWNKAHSPHSLEGNRALSALFLRLQGLLSVGSQI